MTHAQSYEVTMQSGHVYWVTATSEQDAMREAEYLAEYRHGTNDKAVGAVA